MGSICCFHCPCLLCNIPHRKQRPWYVVGQKTVSAWRDSRVLISLVNLKDRVIRTTGRKSRDMIFQFVVEAEKSLRFSFQPPCILSILNIQKSVRWYGWSLFTDQTLESYDLTINFCMARRWDEGASICPSVYTMKPSSCNTPSMLHAKWTYHQMKNIRCLPPTCIVQPLKNIVWYNLCQPS